MKNHNCLLFFAITLLLSCSPSRELNTVQQGLAGFTILESEKAEVFRLRNEADLPIPDGQSSFHQQGVQQLADGGWAVSGSDRETGYLYFTDADGRMHTKFTVPTDLKLSGGAADLKYNHPGGFQVTDHILAVGVENTDHRKDSYGRVILLDVRDPRAPKHLSHLDIVRDANPERIMTVGAVGITALKDAYLIAVGNWDSKRFDFYRTSSKDLFDPATTVSPCLGSWTPGAEGNSYQNFNMYADRSGKLLAVGLYSIDRSQDFADIFQLDLSDWNNIRIESKTTIEFSGGETAPHFVHAAGTYYDRQQDRFRVFSVEAHAHQGMVLGNLWK